MEKISRKGFLKIAAAAAMSSVTAAGLAACNAASSSTAAASSGAAGIYTPGTYTATAKGMSEITATVTFDAASITKVELADTIGVGDPMQVYELFRAVKERYPQLQLLAHMHDTRNNGVANSFAAALAGADVIHGALGGLGGCPFAPGASGNTATEDLVFLMEKSGFRTGIDFPKLLEAAKEMRAEGPGNYSGHQIMIQSVPTGA